MRIQRERLCPEVVARQEEWSRPESEMPTEQRAELCQLRDHALLCRECSEQLTVGAQLIKVLYIYPSNTPYQEDEQRALEAALKIHRVGCHVADQFRLQLGQRQLEPRDQELQQHLYLHQAELRYLGYWENTWQFRLGFSKATKVTPAIRAFVLRLLARSGIRHFQEPGWNLALLVLEEGDF